MPRLLLLAPALLTGCAAGAPPVSSPIPAQPAGAATGTVCRSADYSEFVGRGRSEAVEAELKAQSGARIIRWVLPGMMVTMDYREDRMTVRLDSQNRIISASCG